jgi:sugar lactone lactonase YvrE
MFGKSESAKFPLTLALVALLLLALPPAALAQAPAFPDLFFLPTGFAPEGIATGRGTSFYVGSLSGMGIYAGDLRTGEGRILTAPAGRIHVGLKVDVRSNYLFAAGGATGRAFIYDAATGAEIAALQLATGATFINDVTITRDAAYFTDSQAAVLYRIPLGPGGSVGDPVTFEVIPLTGDWQQVAGFNANGIAATPNGRYLIVVNSTLGTLYRVDPATGYAQQIDLGGASVTQGDGILLEGKTLYVVRNRMNQIAVLRLSPDYLSARLVDTITNPNFNVPTTIARFGNSLYAVNAKFGTPQAGTPYEVVRVER